MGVSKSEVSDNVSQQSLKASGDGLSLTGAQRYLKGTSYDVDIGQLYSMNEDTGTCAYNEQMEYTPVQVRVNPKITDLHAGFRWLLQVWNKKGTKVL